MRKDEKTRMRVKKDKSKMWTRIIAGILAGLMVLGVSATILFSIFA